MDARTAGMTPRSAALAEDPLLTDPKCEGCIVIEDLALPSRLDSSAAASLLNALLARRGQPLQLDASRVELVGALALEVVIAAGRQWDSDGQPLWIKGPSDRFTSACDALGLNARAPWLGLAMAAPGGQE